MCHQYLEFVYLILVEYRMWLPPSWLAAEVLACWLICCLELMFDDIGLV
jgi:hypothetical protein